MRLPRLPLRAAAAALLLAPAAALEAQRSAGGIQRLSAAVGGDARGLGTGDGAGRSLLLGYDLGRVPGGLPVTARLTGTAFGRAGEAAPVRFGGVGLDLTLPLGTAGPVRPYLLAGAGVYALRGTAPPAAGAGPVSPLRATGPTEAAAAFVGGGGVRVPVGRVALFAEARYTAFRGAAGVPGSYVPLVFGLQF